MPFATFQGEHSVEEIADRLFAGLTTKQRATAIAALIRANPQLKRIDEARPGLVLNLPDVQALRPKATEAHGSPERQMLTELGRVTKSYGDGLLDRMQQEIADSKDQIGGLADAEFVKAISRSDDLQSLAKEAGQALETRAKTGDARLTAVKSAFAQITTDIEAVLKRV